MTVLDVIPDECPDPDCVNCGGEGVPQSLAHRILANERSNKACPKCWEGEREYEVTHVDKADAWDAIVEKSREITRLRSELANGQSAGFAAGVEAAMTIVRNRTEKVGKALMQNKAFKPYTLLAKMEVLDEITDAIRDLTPQNKTGANHEN